jgi:non-ribosomal peptide synthetase component E (peptide arylation enzyme)
VTKTATQLPDVAFALDTTWEGPIVDHFTRNAARLPEKIAVIHGNTTLTYRDLDHLSAQLANWMVKNGIKVTCYL